MSLEPGARFGSYQIAAASAPGGWARSGAPMTPTSDATWRSKLVGEAFGDDPERLARFEREAKLLAACHHPNIAVLYGQEDFEGRRALVLELVEGPTLAERLASRSDPAAGKRSPSPARWPRPSRTRTRTASSTATSSPRTSSSTPEGQVKVLDFGLGRPVASEAGPDIDLLELAHAVAAGDARGRDPGDRALHVARAGTRAGGRSPQRHLVVRRDPVRDADGRAALPGGDHLGRARVRASYRGRLGPASRCDPARGAPAPAPLPGTRSPGAAARFR